MTFNKYNQLTFSYSRSKMLNTCPLSYYYYYYGSAGGWKQDAALRTKQIYRLKQLQPLNAIVGEAIHSAITQKIVTTDLSIRDFKRFVNRKIHESYRKSLDHRAEWMEDPKSFPMIQEIYFKGEVGLDIQQVVIDKIDACATNLINCKSIQDILSGSTILSIDELKDYSFAEYKTFIKIDALYQHKDTGDFIVVDWKSGKGGAIELEQLLVYVYFVQHAFNNIPIECIEARLEYLADGDCATYRFTEEDMKMAELTIKNSIIKMQQYLFDVEKNIPLTEAYFAANRSSNCKNCNFQEVCFCGKTESIAIGNKCVSLAAK